jgi:hypothetical protein
MEICLRPAVAPATIRSWPAKTNVVLNRLRVAKPTSGEFVKSLGCYDDVVTYDAVSSMPADQTAVFVDMAGSAKLRGDLHRRLSDRLTCSVRVGMTHMDASSDDKGLPGAKPTWFFAPDQIRKRAKEWGPGGIDTRFNAAWSGLVPMLDRCITVTQSHGQDAVKQVYLDTLNGRVPPDRGYILSLAE